MKRFIIKDTIIILIFIFMLLIIFMLLMEQMIEEDGLEIITLIAFKGKQQVMNYNS